MPSSGNPPWQDSPSTVTPITAARLQAIETAVTSSARLPVSTEKVIWVSTGANAADTNDGLTLGAPKATITAALAALGSNSGTVQVMTGTYTVSAADTHGNGITLAATGQRLKGVGFGATTIVIDTNVTWGIQALAQYCSVEDVYITINAGRAVTYGVGVSTPASTGSAQHCCFSRLLVAVNGTTTAAYSLGPDWAGSSSVDIANTVFDHCTFAVGTGGALTHGWLLGNGTTGNVTANTAANCGGTGSSYGITASGAGFHWFGGGFANVLTADIHVTQAHGDGLFFSGARNENGNQAVNTTYGGPSGPIVLNGCTFEAYTPTGGSELITHNLTGSLILLGGMFTTAGGTTTFHVNDSGGAPARSLVAIGVTTDSANPYPAASAKVNAVILGAQQMTGGNPTPNPSVSRFDGWSPPFDSTAATVKVGSAQTGNVRLAIGSDTTAQTPVLDFKSSGSAPNYDARLLISGGTASDGAGTLTFTGAGFYLTSLLAPYTNTTYDLGAASLQWKNVYANGDVRPLVTKTASYSLALTDHTVIFNAATLTATLPDPTTVLVGRRYVVKNINASALTVVSAGTTKTLDGAASQSIAQWAKASYVSDGTQWLTV